MATGLTDSSNYQAIAEAIRAKNGSDETYTPEEMAAAVMAIEGQSLLSFANIDFSDWTSGEFTVTVDDGDPELGSVTFDADGRPDSITLFGHTLTLTLPGVS